MYTKEDIDCLAADFEQCRKILVALGDENRQHITHLSRPAVSHHLQILKGAGILKMRREGTKNYYYFDPDMKSFELLTGVLQRAIQITSELPDRSENRI